MTGILTKFFEKPCTLVVPTAKSPIQKHAKNRTKIRNSNQDEETRVKSKNTWKKIKYDTDQKS